TTFWTTSGAFASPDRGSLLGAVVLASKTGLDSGDFAAVDAEAAQHMAHKLQACFELGRNHFGYAGPAQKIVALTCRAGHDVQAGLYGERVLSRDLGLNLACEGDHQRAGLGHSGGRQHLRT